MNKLTNQIRKKIGEANNEVVEKIMESHPVLVDIAPAIDAVPGMESDMLLYGGPPNCWEDMIDPVKGAAIGASIYEGWTSSEDEAISYIEDGKVKFSPTADHSAGAPMAGIISPSMPVFVIKNKTYGNYTFSNVNEGLGKTLRYGAYDNEVITTLRWIEKTLMPVLKEVLEKHGEIDVKRLIIGAIHRGDECHNRNKTASNLLLKPLASALFRTSVDREEAAQVLDFINGNPHFFLNLSIASSIACLNAAHDVKYSTIVTRLCTNGSDFGLKLSGLNEEWITAPSKLAEGSYFEGYDEKDAAPVFGDSYNSEPAGLGGFAMAAAPAIGSFIGISPEECIDYTKEMYRITVTEHKYYKIPHLGYRGTPLGIDIRKVVKTGILPIINTGISHKDRGKGQIGAGIVRPPLELFKKAWKKFENFY